MDYEKAAQLNIELGLEYLKQGQVSRAKRKFVHAKELAPQLSEVHYSYGYFLEHVGEIKEAEKFYQKAISLNPKGAIEQNSYGAFLCRQGNYAKGEKAFQQALKDVNDENTAEIYENAGFCAKQIPDSAKAKDYFEKALRHDPDRPAVLLELGIIAYQANNLEQAKAYHTHLMKLSAPTARSLLLGSELAKKMGETDKSASYEMMLKSQFPTAQRQDLFALRSHS